MKKNFLFITHSFPANQSANSLCDQKIIERAAKYNEGKICVLCYRFPGQAAKETIGGVIVYRIKKDYFWGVEEKERSSNYRNKLNVFLTHFLLRFRQILYLPLFPNYEPLAIKNIKKSACRIINDESIQAVVADHNGIDTLLGGAKAAKRKNISFFPIFWDSLSSGIRAKYVSKNYNDTKKIKLEKKIVDESTATFMLRSYKELLSEKYSDSKNLYGKIIFCDIPLFIPTSPSKNPIGNSHNTIRLLFLGNIIGAERNPLPFLYALEKSELNIQFDCFTTTFNDSFLNKLSKRFPFFKLFKPVDVSMIPEKMEHYDFLVNFGVKTPNVLSSKIFTYFSSGKPIITTCSNLQESCVPYVERYPLGFIYKDDVTPIDELKTFLSENKGKKLDPLILKDAFIENTPDFFWLKMSKIFIN